MTMTRTSRRTSLGEQFEEDDIGTDELLPPARRGHAHNDDDDDDDDIVIGPGEVRVPYDNDNSLTPPQASSSKTMRMKMTMTMDQLPSPPHRYPIDDDDDDDNDDNDDIYLHEEGIDIEQQEQDVFCFLDTTEGEGEGNGNDDEEDEESLLTGTNDYYQDDDDHNDDEVYYDAACVPAVVERIPHPVFSAVEERDYEQSISSSEKEFVHDDEYDIEGDEEEGRYNNGSDIDNGSDSDSDSDSCNSNTTSPMNTTTTTPSYRKHGWIGIGLILLVTITAMTGILLWKSNLYPYPQDITTSTSSSLEGNTNDGENNKNDNDNNESTTPMDDDDGNSSENNESPTPAPSQSFAPTITFPYESYDMYYDTLLNIVLSEVYQLDDNEYFTALDININPYAWTDPKTAQFDALRFIAYQDGPISNGIGYYTYDDNDYNDNDNDDNTESNNNKSNNNSHKESKNNHAKLFQRLALLVFYFETGGEFYWIQDEIIISNDDDNDDDNNGNSNGDSSSSSITVIDWIRPGIDECDWIGVTCDYNINNDAGDDYGYVTHLVLSEREAVGKIPVETLIWLGPTLEVLDLSTNRLRGTLPTNIFFFNFVVVADNFDSSLTSLSSLLPKLRVLDLSKNELEGTIPEDIRYGLPSLQVLALSENFLEGPLPLQINTHVLEELLLNSNNLSGTIPFEQWLFSSMEIIMPPTPTTRPTIGLYNNPASSSSLSSSNGGASLKVVDFSNNLLTGTIPHTVFHGMFGQSVFENLEVLALQRNGKLTGTIPTELGLLQQLQQLQVSDCNFEGRVPLEIFFRMPNLERLILAYNRLTGSIPGEIILTHFIQLNENTPDATAVLYPPLNALHLGENQMTGTLPTTLGLLKNLSYLQLFGNDFVGSIPTRFIDRDALDKLSFLWLHDNPTLHGIMPCPEDNSEAVSGRGEGRGGGTGIAQQQEPSTFLNFASDCTSNPNIVCTCCTRCF